MMHGHLARFLARSWPLRPLADWVYSVTNEVLLEHREAARIQALWDVETEAELRELQTEPDDPSLQDDLLRLRDILDGKGPSTLPRWR